MVRPARENDLSLDVLVAGTPRRTRATDASAGSMIDLHSNTTNQENFFTQYTLNEKSQSLHQCIRYIKSTPISNNVSAFVNTIHYNPVMG